MSNKKHNIEEIKTVASTPVTPNLGYSKVYPKPDGEWYRLNDAGNEAPLGGSGGGGTVTSIGLALDTIGTDISISDSPITTSGDITLNIPDASASVRGALTSSDWSIFNNKIGGSGQNNYISKFTPNGTMIGNSQIRDDGTSVGINIAPNVNSKLTVLSTGQVSAIFGQTNINNGIAVYGQAFTGTGTLIGVLGFANSITSTTNIGVNARAQGVGVATNIGIKAEADGATNNYSIQLIDNTQNIVGRYLRNMTTDGKANWANIQVSEVNGAVRSTGTLNYLAKFTPDGTTIGNSLIRDDATSVSINSAPSPTYRFQVSGNTLSCATFETAKVATNISSGIAVFAAATGSSTQGSNIGVYGVASGNSVNNTGIHGASTGSSSGTNIGIIGTASNGSTANIGGYFSASGLGSRAVRLDDATSASYRVLRCLDTDGNAEWTQNLYSFEARSINMDALPSGLTASTAPSTGPYLGTGATDPNARQVILTGLDDNGLGSAYSTSTGEFTVSEEGWYQVGLLISLSAYDGAWSPGTFIIGCVERNTDNGSTILLATSTVDAYGPPQIVLNATRLVKLYVGYVLRVSVLLKGTENYTPRITDTIKFSVVRTA